MSDVDAEAKNAAIEENERQLEQLGVQPAEPTEEAAAVEATPIARTPLEELQAEFAEEERKPRLFKRFPARKGRLAGEYKPLQLKAAKEAQKKDRDDDILIASLSRIMIHAPEHSAAILEGQPGEGLVSLGVWAGQPDLDPLRFDNRLAELLGIPRGTARQIALSLFEGNDLALGIQAGELGTWSGEGYDKALQDFGAGS
ncbi:MAG: hypothetical protein WAU42_14810 [Solirubrobacteraceae bacterium]